MKRLFNRRTSIAKRKRQTRRLGFLERLEQRRMLAVDVDLNGSTLQVEGTNADEGVVVGYFDTFVFHDNGAVEAKEQIDEAVDLTHLVVFEFEHDIDMLATGDMILLGDFYDVDFIEIDGRGGVDLISNFTMIDSEIDGGDGDDVIGGGLGRDVIYGRDGDDEIRDYSVELLSYLQGSQPDGWNPPAASDEYYGGDGNDLLIGGIGGDYFEGNAGNDSLYGQWGDDTLYGGDGDDQLNGNEGDDELWGEDGNDILRGDYSGFGTFVGVDTLHGGAGNDIISGDAGDDTAHGDAGDDIIAGGDGNDTLHGGDGRDQVLGDEGSDELHGDAGPDRIHGGPGHDVMFGGDDDDIMVGEDGADRLEGGEGNDRLFGDELSGVYLLVGDVNAPNPWDDATFVYNLSLPHASDGDGDVIVGGAGHDVVLGGGGDDTLYGGEESDAQDGGNGDGLDYVDGGAGDDLLYGGGADDYLEGDSFVVGGLGLVYIPSGDDILDGGDGNDILNGHNGDDRLFGGAGDDVLNPGGGFDHEFHDEQYDPNKSLRDYYDDIRNQTNGSTTLNDGLLSLSLYAAINYVQLTQNDAGIRVAIRDGHGNELVDSVFAGVEAIEVTGGSGHDIVSVRTNGVDVSFLAGDGQDQYFIGGDTNMNDIVDVDSNSISFNGASHTFSSIERLIVDHGHGTTTINAFPDVASFEVSGGRHDLFYINALDDPTGMVSLSGGGTGNDIVYGPDRDNVWNIASDGTVTLNSLITISGVSSLTGNEGADIFRFDEGGAVEGTIDGGGGHDIFDYSTLESPIVIDLIDPTTMNATGAGSIVSNIERILGGSSATDTISGFDSTLYWDVNYFDWATVRVTSQRKLIFRSFENLIGGAASDFFRFSQKGHISGLIDGGGGDDRLEFTNYSRATTFTLHGGGTLGATTAHGIQSVSNVERVTGSPFEDTLIGPDANQYFYILGDDAGRAVNFDSNSPVAFSAVENLVGGASNDQFVFYGDAALSGSIEGGSGRKDFLRYKRYDDGTGAGVHVDLMTGMATSVGGSINSIEYVEGSLYDDFIRGDENRNYLSGYRGGSDIILGMGGDDSLRGGLGRNILIGGAGFDQISGSNADDLLIGGATIYDARSDAAAIFTAIRDVWRQTDQSFEQRVASLRNGIVTTLTTDNGQSSTETILLDSSTVIDDGDEDIIAGGSGRDWFFGLLGEMTDFESGDLLN